MSESKNLDQRPAILITGASGGLASILTDMLIKDYRLIGVDPRPMPQNRNFPGEFYQIRYTQRKIADLFRRYEFKTFIHLGRIRAVNGNARTRFDTNVLGTRNLLNLCKRYGVKNTIIFSTYHVYGAHQFNHAYIREEEPLRAAQTFPELVDAVELDHAATTFLWQNRDVRTVILRPVNVIGRQINNTITSMLRANVCPVLMGYDPLQQFIHAQDVARALKLCLESDKSGIYNVAGEGTISWSKAVETANAMKVSVPEFVAYPLVSALNKFKSSFPRHLINYFKYPTVISDQAFRDDFGYEASVNTIDTLRCIH